MDFEIQSSAQQPMWENFWAGHTPEAEIAMRDFYGGRQWIMKHVPRYGNVIEAGCGLGRWVFYLSKLGINIEGVDLHPSTIDIVKDWAHAHGFTDRFRVGDVTDLPYDDGTISGYLSFGVIEHFEEGPARPLAEAYRVLRPGGIAVITTPSVSFAQTFFRFRSSLRNATKGLVLRIGLRGMIERMLQRTIQIHQSSFFQHWYNPKDLVYFIEQAGLKVVLSGGGDLKYAFLELGIRPDRRKFGFRIVDLLEHTELAKLGAQAFTVSIKAAPVMHCFICGKRRAGASSLTTFYLPICHACAGSSLAKYYRKGVQKPRFHCRWEYNPPLVSNPYARNCFFCRTEFEVDMLFEDFGFSVPVCPDCLKKPVLNLKLSNEYLKPVWRMRNHVA